MFTLKNRVLPVVVGAAVIVGAANLTAYAANGHALLLGQSNNESHTATIVNQGPGPALSVATRDDTPPFEISSQAKVRHLNADRVDSMTSSQLSHAYHYVLPKHAQLGIEFKLTGLPRGTYVASYQIETVNAVSSPTLCNLADTSTDFALESYGVPGPSNNEISTATGLVVVKHQGEAVIECTGGESLRTHRGSQNAVTFTPVVATTQGKVKDIASRSAQGHGFGR